MEVVGTMYKERWKSIESVIIFADVSKSNLNVLKTIVCASEITEHLHG